MNHLSIVNKHLKGLEAAYSSIRTEETRERAKLSIQMACGRMAVPGLPDVDVKPVEFVRPGSVSAASGESITLGGVVGGPVVQEASGVVSEASVRVEVPFVDQGGPGPGVVAIPVVPEEPAVVGDLEGSGTFYPETVTAHDVGAAEVANEIGGWPEYAQIRTVGLYPNRRSVKGFLGDGRTVHVERRLGWVPGEIRGRLVRAGSSPLYRITA